jgi:hypothetical protein
LTTSTTLSHVQNGIDCIRDSQVALQTQMTEHVVTVRKALDARIFQKYQAQPILVDNDPTALVVIYGSLSDGVALLELLHDDIRRILFPSGSATTPNIPRDVALWLLSQWHALLTDLLLLEEEQELMECPTKRIPYHPHEPSPEFRGWRDQSQAVPPVVSLHSSRRNVTFQQKNKIEHKATSCATGRVETTISAGNLSFTIEWGPLESGKADSKRRNTAVRALFIPEQGTSQVGIAIQIARKIYTTPSTSRIISTSVFHPNNSPIFAYLEAGDKSMVCELLSTKKVSPNDRDENGNALLWVIIPRQVVQRGS